MIHPQRLLSHGETQNYARKTIRSFALVDFSGLIAARCEEKGSAL
jgi:hypothetical protein